MSIAHFSFLEGCGRKSKRFFVSILVSLASSSCFCYFNSRHNTPIHTVILNNDAYACIWHYLPILITCVLYTRSYTNEWRQRDVSNHIKIDTINETSIKRKEKISKPFSINAHQFSIYIRSIVNITRRICSNIDQDQIYLTSVLVVKKSLRACYLFSPPLFENVKNEITRDNRFLFKIDI